MHRGYYVSSHRADAKGTRPRDPEALERCKSAHYCLDVVFGEGRRTLRSESDAQNFALVTVTDTHSSMLEREPTKEASLRGGDERLGQGRTSSSHCIQICRDLDALALLRTRNAKIEFGVASSISLDVLFEA